jgi:hypothetical protein
MRIISPTITIITEYDTTYRKDKRQKYTDITLGVMTPTWKKIELNIFDSLVV